MKRISLLALGIIFLQGACRPMHDSGLSAPSIDLLFPAPLADSSTFTTSTAPVDSMSKDGDENVALIVFLTFLPFAIGVFAACLLQFGVRKKKKDPQPPVEDSKISDDDDLEAGAVSKKVIPETSNGAEASNSGNV